MIAKIKDLRAAQKLRHEDNLITDYIYTISSTTARLFSVSVGIRSETGFKPGRAQGVSSENVGYAGIR